MLRTLGLNDNRMETVDEMLFWNNSFLEILDLSNNRIHSINPEAFKQNRKLYFLNLSGNNLTHVDAAILSEMPNLRIIQLDDNPWHCDCKLAPLREWFVGKSVDLTQTRCDEPETLRGRPWSEIKSEEFVCS
ncbi:Hypothetical predicted protein [Cloeon dipterum]|uniref:LRRCT domain-containing protein n=1 Tax=Cloeon dipterum TaxID=197152 RepID=A0A8S1DGH5_9INSE|nr:Hypothetical predicted protein [Cloeon dipterum]